MGDMATTKDLVKMWADEMCQDEIYILNTCQRYCLTEVVTGTIETKHNNFIIYSRPQ